DLTDGAKTCIFSPDGFFGIHNGTPFPFFASSNLRFALDRFLLSISPFVTTLREWILLLPPKIS
ncbi:MAG: hypothetical protein DMG57_17410, partial [Acidobacteria bacterium]